MVHDEVSVLPSLLSVSVQRQTPHMLLSASWYSLCVLGQTAVSPFAVHEPKSLVLPCVAKSDPGCHLLEPVTVPPLTLNLVTEALFL